MSQRESCFSTLVTTNLAVGRSRPKKDQVLALTQQNWSGSPHLAFVSGLLFLATAILDLVVLSSGLTVYLAKLSVW